MDIKNDTSYTLYNYLDAFWRRRYLIGIFVICMPIIGLVSGIISSKRYEATISLATFSTAPPSMKELSYIPDIKEQFAGISAYITSVNVLEKVALQAGLVKPNSNEKTAQAIAADLAKQITVTLVEKNAVQIKLIGSNQKAMVAILNALSSVFITEFLNPMNSSAQSASLFLKTQLDQQQKKLKESMDELTDFENKNSAFLPKYGDIYTTRLGQIINQLGDMEAQHKAMAAEKIWLANVLTNVNPVLGNLEKAISENDVKLNQMREIYTDSYPGIQSALVLDRSLRAERDRVRKQYPKTGESKIQQLMDIELNAAEKVSTKEKSNSLLATQLSAYQILEQKLKGLEGQIAELTTQKNELTHTLTQVESTKKKLSILSKAVAENQEIYQDLLKRYDMTTMTLQLNDFEKFSPIKIVSSPEGPFLNTARPLIFYILIGILGGICLGLGMALILELLDDSVRQKQTIEALTGILVISRIEKINFG